MRVWFGGNSISYSCIAEAEFKGCQTVKLCGKVHG